MRAVAARSSHGGHMGATRGSHGGHMGVSDESSRGTKLARAACVACAAPSLVLEQPSRSAREAYR
eukprot:3972173-Prymnesium_polylepis.1